MAGLVFDAAGSLYGTTVSSGNVSCKGAAGCGTVFKLTPNSNGSWTGETLHIFQGKPAEIRARAWFSTKPGISTALQKLATQDAPASYMRSPRSLASSPLGARVAA